MRNSPSEEDRRALISHPEAVKPETTLKREKREREPTSGAARIQSKEIQSGGPKCNNRVQRCLIHKIEWMYMYLYLYSSLPKVFSYESSPPPSLVAILGLQETTQSCCSLQPGQETGVIFASGEIRRPSGRFSLPGKRLPLVFPPPCFCA